MPTMSDEAIADVLKLVDGIAGTTVKIQFDVASGIEAFRAFLEYCNGNYFVLLSPHGFDTRKRYQKVPNYTFEFKFRLSVGVLLQQIKATVFQNLKHLEIVPVPVVTEI